VNIKRTASVAAEITHVQLSVESGGGFDGSNRRVASVDKAVAKVDGEQIAAAPSVPALTHAAATA
jgi:cytoskeletal protein CcmA (bactofilin family)